MNLTELKKQIILKCKEMNIPLTGFAPVERWEKQSKHLPNKFKEWIPEEFWPQSIYPECKTVIVIGLPLPPPIIDTAPSIYYHELYKTVNNLLDIRAYELANFITEKGYPSISLPRDGYGDIEVLLKKPLAFFSHKHAAYLAGLGSFGLSNVLLTPEYGPRVRFNSIFTSAPLEPSPLNSNDLCTRCLECFKKCPANSIPPENLKNEFFPDIIDKKSCALRSKSLRKEYRSPCGICIKVCPVGKDRIDFKRDIKTGIAEDKYKKARNHIQSYGTKLKKSP